MFISYTFTIKYTAKNKCIRIYDIFKIKDCVVDILEMGKYEIYI